MEKKIKFIILGLAVILIISLFISFSAYSTKQAIEQENKDLNKENVTLIAKINKISQDAQNLENMNNSLKKDLEKVSWEKDEVQKKYELIDKEREELIAKIETLKKEKLVQAPPSPSVVQAVPESFKEDAYWAGILKAKKDLEVQLENLRYELKTAQVKSDDLQRNKGILELEITGLSREVQDLKQQSEYNQKVINGLAQDLVREKDDKFQIQKSLKFVRNENALLKRQLKNLSNRKIKLEQKLTQLQKENQSFEDKFSEMDTLLKDRTLQIAKLKEELKELEGLPAVSSPEQKATAIETHRGAVELPPIIVRPQVEAVTEVVSPLEGKILAVNKENNFVIVDLGEDKGVKVGETFQVYRQNEAIATVEVIQVRKSITACDIKKQVIDLKIGDTVK